MFILVIDCTWISDSENSIVQELFRIDYCLSTLRIWICAISLPFFFELLWSSLCQYWKVVTLVRRSYWGCGGWSEMFGHQKPIGAEAEHRGEARRSRQGFLSIKSVRVIELMTVVDLCVGVAVVRINPVSQVARQTQVSRRRREKIFSMVWPDAGCSHQQQSLSASVASTKADFENDAAKTESAAGDIDSFASQIASWSSELTVASAVSNRSEGLQRFWVVGHSNSGSRSLWEDCQ